MADSVYFRALCSAGLLAAGGYFQGNTVWRRRGLDVVRLLVESYLERLRAFSRPVLVEHDFLLPEVPYREVFPDYENVYTARLSAPTAGGWVLRPDNLQASIGLLAESGGTGPLVAVGGLLRRYPGSVEPLFRERYIWPAVQVTELVARERSVYALDRHQRALEDLIRGLALPVVSVAVDGLSEYGSRCYLTVSCLPDGRPTVLSTSYIMSDKRRDALGVRADVLDIGFTGKLLAVVALHHQDLRGLALPAALAPVQVGLTRLGHSADVPEPPWYHALREAGIRTAVRDERQSIRAKAWRAERRWHREGVPLVATVRRDDQTALGDAVGAVVLSRRLELQRAPIGEDVTPGTIRRELEQHDARWLERAERRFDRALVAGGVVCGMCQDCAARRTRPVFGWLTPGREAPCASCSGQGKVALISEQGRFY